MFKWLKKLSSIVRKYDADLKETREKIKEMEKIIGDRTTISADLGFRDPSYVIVVGRYRHVDYVQVFQLETNELESVIDILESMRKNGRLLRIDAPPAMKMIVERELKGPNT